MLENYFEESNLLFFNGLGGFSKDGREYIIHLKDGENTPVPWVNVIANPDFGFVTTESGSGYTWYENAHEFRLTSWSNDTITEQLADVIYIKEEHGNKIWSPTFSPIRSHVNYLIRHGFGYSVFESIQNDIYSRLTQFVPVKDSVKLNLLSLHNRSDERRNFSLTYYMQPVLGEQEAASAPYIVSETIQGNKLVFSNPFSEDYSEYATYIDVSIHERSFSGNRESFFGSGSQEVPDALSYEHLDGVVGAGYDPCGALQVHISIDPHETLDVVFQMGASESKDSIDGISTYYRDVDNVKNELERVEEFWNNELSDIKVHTPDLSFDILMNGWLQYQTISSRLFGRSGFYQSGGAFGFRDQLQDALALTITDPKRVKEQILLHAKHQFLEGDVQHWWHPPYNKGVRTRITDDRLWLVYVTYEYIKKTNDYSILDEELEFLVSPILLDGEDERYEIPGVSSEKTSLYDHCKRAIDISLQFGEHGLPLMGGGDWNDGMNLVGIEGKGESVWLGWFLADVLRKMIDLSKKKNDTTLAGHYSQELEDLKDSLEEQGWDGKWYRRAYYDDGSPLGSHESDDCKIDSISQSWAVISGFSTESRKKKALQSLEENLVDRRNGIIKLLTPPFDKGEHNPGYIKNYVPGVRENGGQYSHAAVWTVVAFAKLRKKDKALSLFNMINPINHTSNYRDVIRYKNEPYVMSADVYSVYPHIGRAGWSWYTGAASWMYQAGLESILGFDKLGEKLFLDPIIPNQWKSFKITYNYFDTKYKIEVLNIESQDFSESKLYLDSILQTETSLDLVNDGFTHKVRLEMSYIP